MILILNPGSSSLKAKVFDKNLKVLEYFKFDRIGTSEIKNHTEACQKMVEEMKAPDEIEIVGYRVVHGGSYFKKPTEINQKTINRINELSSLAPLHNPVSVEVIKISQDMFTQAKHFAFFDTSFFADLPIEASIYPLPYNYFQEGVKRYGFHGISHQYAAEEGAKFKKTRIEKMEMVTVHLGQGSSVAVMQNGRPIDTTMGYTPLEGLPMMTRSGSIDPGIILKMISEGKSEKKIERILEQESGLYGISGVSSDMRDILFVAGCQIEDTGYKPPKDIKCSEDDIKRSKIAIEVFTRSVKKYLGGYFTLLNRVDLVVFTGEIGYGSSLLRNKICENFNIETLAVKPNEELAIARKIINIK